MTFSMEIPLNHPSNIKARTHAAFSVTVSIPCDSTPHLKLPISKGLGFSCLPRLPPLDGIPSPRELVLLDLSLSGGAKVWCW